MSGTGSLVRAMCAAVGANIATGLSTNEFVTNVRHVGPSGRSRQVIRSVLNGKAIGLFYADMEAANSLQVSQRQLGLLRTLRNQAVLAIKQKQ